MFSATSAQKTKLGLFVVAAAGLLALVLFLFAGLRLARSADRYYARTGDSVSGLRTGASVEVRGVPVGRVAQIELQGGRADPVLIALEVDAGTPIPNGARAVLRMQGVTGLMYVDIEGGDFQGPVRRPGDFIPTRPSALSEIADQGSALVQESQELVAQGKQFADQSSALVQELRELVAQGKRAVDQLADILDADNRAQVERILARGEQAMGHLEQAAEQAQRTGAGLEQLVAGQGGQAVQAAGELVGDARRLVQANRQQIGAAVADLREAARSFRRMAESLERDPSRLLFRRRTGERELP